MSEGTILRHAGLMLMPMAQVAELSNGYPWNDPNYILALIRQVESSQNETSSYLAEPDDHSLSDQAELVLNYIESFIEAEHEIEEQQARQTPSFHYQDWVALDKRYFGRQHFRLFLDEDDYSRLLDLKPGLLAPIDPGGEPSAIRLEVTELQPIQDQPAIDVSVEQQTAMNDLPKSGELLLSATPTQRNIRMKVLEQLREGKSANPWLLPLLAGEHEFATFVPAEVPIPASPYPPTSSQLEAINRGAGTPDLSLVLGPPGTGKTTVIVRWASYFAQQGLRVLVASQSNKAVDNVLERLTEEDGLQCVRLGHESKISSALHESLLDNRVRLIQQELLDNEATVKARGQQSIDYLLSLESRKSAIKKARKSCSKDDEALVKARKRRDSAKDKLDKLHGRHEALELDINTSRQRRTAIEESRWNRFLEPVRTFFLSPRRLWLDLRIKRLSRKIRKLKPRLETQGKTFNEVNTAFEGAERAYLRSKAELDDLFSDRPFNTFGGLSLPDAESLDWARLKDLKRRISSIASQSGSWYEGIRIQRDELNQLSLEKVNVVGATCIGINTKALFRDMSFDVVIIDESGQIQAHNLIVPVSRAARVIMVGDHKQLPPVVLEEIETEVKAREEWNKDLEDLFRKSWFELLWNQIPSDRKVMLDTQFRCPAIISDFVSKAFYDGIYRAGAGMEEKPPLFSFTQQPMVLVDTSGAKERFESSRDLDGRLEVIDNPLETRLVVELLKAAISEHPGLASNREIGVIVPYANHVRAIQNAIRKQRSGPELGQLQTPLNELVASVDSFQGQERELIIFTFTRSNRHGTVGFLADWRRLNVAMTRARKQLILVGDLSTLARQPKTSSRKDAEFKQAMLTLRSFCQQRGALIALPKSGKLNIRHGSNAFSNASERQQ